MSALSAYQIRLIHSLGDFQQTLSALTWIDELEPDQKMTRVELRRYRCLEDAAVVAYWRPFSESKGLPKLSFKRLGIIPTEEEQDLHSALRTQRNKVVAHTDADRMRFGIHAWKPLEDRDIIMPHFIRDDSLAFYLRRTEWLEWTRKIHHQIAEVVFQELQSVGEISIVEDYLRTAESKATST